MSSQWGRAFYILDCLPQVAETNSPRPMDAVGESLLYYELTVGVPAYINRMFEY
jgi:hypothetical protein